MEIYQEKKKKKKNKNKKEKEKEKVNGYFYILTSGLQIPCTELFWRSVNSL